MRMKSKGFKEKTKRLFLKYTFIPISILFVLFFLFTLIIFQMRTTHETNQAADEIDQEFSEVYQSYHDEIIRMSKLPVVKYNLQTHLKNNLVYEEFYHFNSNQSVKSAFHLINTDGVFLASSTPSDRDINREIWGDIIPRIQKNPTKVLTEVNTINYTHGKTATFTFGQAVLEEEQVVGYIVYQLYEEDLQDLIFGHNADMVVITDEYDRVVVATNNIVKGLMNKFNPEMVTTSNVKIQDKRYYMEEKHRLNGNFNIYTLSTTNNYSFVIMMYLVFFMITSALLFLFIRKLAEKMSSQNVRSIEKLLSPVSKLKEGDLTSYVKIKTGDEFETLADRYNDMLHHLNQLVQKNEELSHIQKVNEIKLLQSQFNPHFIFNVLETLRYTMHKNTDKAQEIILSLSRLLRYSITNETRNVLFEHDLNYILDYLKLHKFRFNDRLNYTIRIPEAIENTFVPKLLLQPIIENSIKYGYQSQSHLNLFINGEIHQNDIIFTIKDDGNGIPRDKLTEIKRNLNSSKPTTEAIGLYNTHRSLILLYGDDYGITIDSDYGKGTTVKVKIPYREGGANDVQSIVG